MTETTFSRRFMQLVHELRDHPNRDEIIKLAQEQIVDDTFVLVAKDV